VDSGLPVLAAHHPTMAATRREKRRIKPTVSEVADYRRPADESDVWSTFEFIMETHIDDDAAENEEAIAYINKEFNKTP
jgi:hypothetical protein